MDFTIVTPSYRQLDLLACCISSVADQEEISVEHIVQDAGTEGFVDFDKKMASRWPDRPGYRRVMISEKDVGMYDAINKGLKRASGVICAYLNCDEQYLPGTLRKVKEKHFAESRVDLWLGDVLVIHKDGSGVCHRKMVVPSLSHTWTCHFGALTAGIFFSTKLVEEGFLFDTSYQIASDAEWYTRILRAHKKVKTLRITTSTFVDSGENLGVGPRADAERNRLDSTAPWQMRWLKLLWILVHRCKRVVGGAHHAGRMDWSIYMPGASSRKAFHAEKLRTTWPGRFWSR
jgi:glycosyltransferase involved in cell wall biosynthesis